MEGLSIEQSRVLRLRVGYVSGGREPVGTSRRGQESKFRKLPNHLLGKIVPAALRASQMQRSTAFETRMRTKTSE